ncbi:AraC family transcriptional regulator [Streptomyces oryzae]|uniref:AraC family transcriptional regulator n=1 Tax=Streptomyces oryzae TaxID=1434886 RepID=A0ABS3XL37_9ACTN|nr:AraC family transcriptional regulator [Streptomyces oryzae]MBO8196128.1 AraC family transcriptional regulator [Streptomyces oryzae]
MDDPVRRIRMRTSDPQEAEDFLRRTYTEHTPQLSGDRDRFRFDAALTQAGAIGVERLAHSMRMRAEAEPSHCVYVVQVLGGTLEVAAGRNALRSGPGDLHLCDPYAPTLVNWDNVRLGVVRIGLREVERVAADLAGTETATARLSFARPVSPERARYWQAVVRHIGHDVLGNPQAAASPLILDEAARLLATAALATFPHTSAERSRLPSPGWLAPAALRRAMAYIDANAAHPLTLRDIAQAARSSPRALQHAFARHCETTPTGYLRQVRLEGAHRELQAADPSQVTVAAVAARWGFAKAGRFSAQYRERYGVSPSHTLRT